MKLLGHAWVAVNSYPEGKRDQLILGSILPEVYFYTLNIKGHFFKHEEIHEGGLKFYQYLKKESPDLKDLGIGMITHGNKYGVDKFNYGKYLELLGYKGEKKQKIQPKLMSTLNLNKKQADICAHNIFELALELGLESQNPKFVEEFEKALNNKLLIEHASFSLSKCFHKPQKKVLELINELMNKTAGKYNEGSFGLAKLWAELVEDMYPKFDPKKLAPFLEELHDNFKGKDKIFIEKGIVWTKGNLKKLL